MKDMTDTQKLALLERRIGRLQEDLKNVPTQSDQVVYLLADINERLQQALWYDQVFAGDR